MTARELAKRFAEGCLAGAGMPALARRRHRERCAILAYHNVVPTGNETAGDRSLHLPQRDFGRQLDRLLRTHRVVPLDRLARDPDGDGRPRAAITFDDAYAGAVTAGVEELVSRSLPATIFTVPGMLGGRSFWWDRLADAPTGGLAHEVRESALVECEGRDERVSAWAAEKGLEDASLPAHALTATIDQLRRAAGQPGISIGSHTWSHANLAALDEEAARAEIDRAADWLLEEFGAADFWLSYPYGLTSETARELASRRHAGALEISGGLARPDRAAGRFDVPRINIPAGITAIGFDLRAAGVVR